MRTLLGALALITTLGLSAAAFADIPPREPDASHPPADSGGGSSCSVALGSRSDVDLALAAVGIVGLAAAGRRRARADG